MDNEGRIKYLSEKYNVKLPQKKQRERSRPKRLARKHSRTYYYRHHEEMKLRHLIDRWFNRAIKEYNGTK